MFDGRIYRAAFLPLLLVLAIAGFSLSPRPAALSSTLAPDAFDGARAFATLRWLATHYPDRRPASAGDEELARYVARTIREAAGPGGGFQVSLRRYRAQTIAGERTLTSVIAERAGSTSEAPIAIVAHRDAARPGSAAELSGTAALIELARVFSHNQSKRTIVLVSTSGGSGGDAGAAAFAAQAASQSQAASQPETAIVLGDLAGPSLHGPFVVPFSQTAASAPAELAQTLDNAISQEVGSSPDEFGLGVQLAHMSFPLALGEQAPLDAAGIPTVLVQVSGERGPTATEPVSQTRLQNFGRAVLSAVYALDEGPNLEQQLSAGLVVGRKLLPSWAVRMLALALLLPALLASIDALARARRYRQPLGRAVAWAASCCLPLLAGALFAILLGGMRLMAAPHALPSAQALASVGSLGPATAATAIVLVLGLLCRPSLVRRLSLPPRPEPALAAVAIELVLGAVALVVWVLDPFACLLLVPATHACLLVSSDSMRRRAAALLAAAAALAPIALLMLVYGRELAFGPSQLAESAVLLLAGGQIGLIGALMWSLALGCALALLMLARREQPRVPEPEQLEPPEIVTRGPLSYAGPGSLGGTESALRR